MTISSKKLKNVIKKKRRNLKLEKFILNKINLQCYRAYSFSSLLDSGHFNNINPFLYLLRNRTAHNLDFLSPDILDYLATNSNLNNYDRDKQFNALMYALSDDKFKYLSSAFFNYLIYNSDLLLTSFEKETALLIAVRSLESNNLDSNATIHKIDWEYLIKNSDHTIISNYGLSPFFIFALIKRYDLLDCLFKKANFKSADDLQPIINASFNSDYLKMHLGLPYLNEINADLVKQFEIFSTKSLINKKVKSKKNKKYIKL